MKSKFKKILFSVIAISCIGLIAVFVLSFRGTMLPIKPASQVLSEPKHALILFYSNQCPHCTQVRKYLADNKLVQKFNVLEKEISGDPKIRKIFIEALKGCYKNKKDLEVNLPVLWDGENCVQGVTEVINKLTNYEVRTTN